MVCALPEFPLYSLRSAAVVAAVPTSIDDTKLESYLKLLPMENASLPDHPPCLVEAYTVPLLLLWVDVLEVQLDYQLVLHPKVVRGSLVRRISDWIPSSFCQYRSRLTLQDQQLLKCHHHSTVLACSSTFDLTTTCLL